MTDDTTERDESTETTEEHGFLASAKRAFASTAEESGDAGTSVGTRTGEVVGNITATVVHGWGKLLLAFVTAFLKLMPKGSGVFSSAFETGAKGLLKTSGADVLLFVIYGDGAVMPKPAAWHSTEGEIRTGNGERYKTNGIDPKRLNGKLPVFFALRESAEITDPLEGYMGLQRGLGNFTEAERIDAQDVSTAATDGGYNDIPSAQKEVLIQAETTGYDGPVLSFTAGWRLFGSKITQEDMENQATRARLAELEDLLNKGGLREVLIFAAGAAMILIGQAVADGIVGKTTESVVNTAGETVPTIMPVGAVDALLTVAPGLV